MHLNPDFNIVVLIMAYITYKTLISGSPGTKKLMEQYDEKRLQKVIRSTGGSWDKGKILWNIFYGDVVNLGLENRIVEK